jgi:hypothetical protein|tara:strand:- start:991 stop:2493 length:1503 start_codon:yes stop_codon:yes gene_type:complete
MQLMAAAKTTMAIDHIRNITCCLVLLVLAAGYASPMQSPMQEVQPKPSRWLAGDHHIHSRYSIRWNVETDPPTPLIGVEALYPIPMNALMAKHFGLSWTVATDHGEAGHAKINLERAYPELVLSREVVPEVIQFYGMELNSPGADHSSIIIPYSPGEAEQLYLLESTFDRKEVYPPDPARNTEERMLEALEFMKEMKLQPVVIAHHPSRSAPGLGEYGLYQPSELRRWNDSAAQVAVGMEGSPGHQAMTLNPDGSIKPRYPRTPYETAFFKGYPTMGAFDQMTARLGGFWDSMLGEGRHWWITANSDSHRHYTEGGSDFWPGEYSKTYVFAEKNHDSILEGIRNGRMFVTTGDLISELFVTAAAGTNKASIGGELAVPPGADIEITIRMMDPNKPNLHGVNAKVKRVDLIIGDITGKAEDTSTDTNDSTKVVKRFTKRDWQHRGEYMTMTHTIEDVATGLYLRVRGTNTEQLEPERDGPGEDVWQDLWFYSNPVFVLPRQ